MHQRLSPEQSQSCRHWEENTSMGTTFLRALRTLLSAHYPPQHQVSSSRSSQPYLQAPNVFFLDGLMEETCPQAQTCFLASLAEAP